MKRETFTSFVMLYYVVLLSGGQTTASATLLQLCDISAHKQRRIAQRHWHGYNTQSAVVNVLAFAVISLSSL